MKVSTPFRSPSVSKHIRWSNPFTRNFIFKHVLLFKWVVWQGVFYYIPKRCSQFDSSVMFTPASRNSHKPLHPSAKTGKKCSSLASHSEWMATHTGCTTLTKKVQRLQVRSRSIESPVKEKTEGYAVRPRIAPWPWEARTFRQQISSPHISLAPGRQSYYDTIFRLLQPAPHTYAFVTKTVSQ